MRRFCWNLTILCIFVFQSGAEVKASSDNEQVSVAVTLKEGIEAAHDALSTFDNSIEREIPWSELKQSLDEMDNFRNDISTETFSFIQTIKTSVKNAIDAHFFAKQSIYEGFKLTSTYLQLYIKLFTGYNEKKFESQKQLLVKVLDGGVEVMTEAVANLEKSVFHFNSVDENFKALGNELNAQRRLIERRTEHIVRKHPSYDHIQKLLKDIDDILRFYSDLNHKIWQASRGIVYANDLISKKIQRMSDLKVKTEQTVRFVNFDDQADLRQAIIQAAQGLISKFGEFQKEHA